MQQAQDKITALTDALCGVIRGNRDCIEVLVISLLSNGSVLMQDVPGVGKTTLAKAVAKAIDVQFHRVQFTPDLLPAIPSRVV
ncbi:AAA family ATPase [Novipirellula artificiosorum]|uniref:ATPase family associated with various cellular activities (AAA) n=1 Tax=Novipirellula artificiosorum TaxID=2528016 RepID=A0A5C6DNT2_9BACT|nr:AAA family ATPase [Novipirellula artificiosorum]TWU37321.1 ATPase family associated with various cellular activities (AAA) [Novipirellula artificiosorum]